MEKLFLRAVATSVEQCGDDQSDFMRVYNNMYTLTVVDGLKIPAISELLRMTARLTSLRLILSEHSRADVRQKIMLNADCDDIHYALSLKETKD